MEEIMRKNKLKTLAFLVSLAFSPSLVSAATCPSKEAFTNDVFAALRKDDKATINGVAWRVTAKSHKLPNVVEMFTKDKFRREATFVTANAPGSTKCTYHYPVSRVQTKTIRGDETRSFELVTP
jgi:hypothetical protein